MSIEKITRIGLDGPSVVVHLWPEAPLHGRAPTGREHTIRLSVKATQELLRLFQKLLNDPNQEEQLKAIGLIANVAATARGGRKGT